MKTRFLALLSLATALAVPAAAQERLRLSTTTSTDNSGLLKVLLPPFEKASGVKVDVIAVGTGKALKLGESGDVDVVLTHDPGLEDRFVAAGFGVDRRSVMHNDFVVVGPASDPAGLKGAPSAAEAFRRIGAGKAPFVSRGDESGTHQKEKALWMAAGVKPGGAWYLQAGQGMGEVLQMADEKRGYTLSDRGTFIAYQKKVELVILSQGDPVLFNPYSVIAVNPARHPHVKRELARKFMDYLTGPEGQKVIAGFTQEGKQLFFPDALK
ncbi:MAG TPA: substrate-binding domain-containing protein [Anaeromyxobacteraceae bacterium]|nr:substrate-binding domain-containing protein [Anaeromyxobacteraceae bacterium]